MGCKMLSEEGGTGLTALYDSTTMVAFGPVMPNATWAEGFLKWLGRDPGPAAGPPLIDSWAEYESTHAECEGCRVNMARRPEHGAPLCQECGPEEREADEKGAHGELPQGRWTTAPGRRPQYHASSLLFEPPA